MVRELGLPLDHAVLVVDRAPSRGNATIRRMLRQKSQQSSCHSSRSSISLHSLPSLTSDSSVSRWESSLPSPKKASRVLSPPQRRRPSLNELVRAPDLGYEKKHQVPPAKCLQSPKFPQRQSSFTLKNCIPQPPCWMDEDDDPSPRSVREGLDKILSKALEECVIDDSASVDMDYESESIVVLV